MSFISKPAERMRAASSVTSTEEIRRLYDIEYGEPAEFILRMAGVILGSILAYFYLGQMMVFLWPALFALCHLGNITFLSQCREAATEADVIFASLWFLAILAAFLWFPTYLIVVDDQALTLCGAALIGCILVFLVRRCDAHPVQTYGQAGVLALFVAIAMGSEALHYQHPLVRLGLLGSGIALIFYFNRAARQARDIKHDAARGAERTVQLQKMSAIGQLAGGVAHDFNNNLTAIIGNLELHPLIVEEGEREELLENAIIAARQASETVSQLLLFARKERLTIEELQPNEIIAQVNSLTERLLPSSVRVTVRISENARPFLGARNQVVSALINLMTNAVDAMPRGGQIDIGVSAARFDEPAPASCGTSLRRGDYTRFSITDTGSGIPAGLLDRVFEPFFSTKSPGRGTGLGLPMVAGVAEELGGGVRIVTSPSGTRVSMLIPAASVPDI